MAEAPQSIAPNSYSCWDTVKEWSLQNPNKIALAIAVIFTIGALVAHYAFSAALGWPVGIGVAGFVAVIMAKWKLKVEESKGYQIKQLVDANKPIEALQFVNSMSVKYRDDGITMLRYILIVKRLDTRGDENNWLTLIRKIDEVDPSQKHQKDRTGETPIGEAQFAKDQKVQNIFGVTNG